MGEWANGRKRAFTPPPFHPFIFKGIAHVLAHATKDENDVAQAGSLRHWGAIFSGIAHVQTHTTKDENNGHRDTEPTEKPQKISVPSVALWLFSREVIE